MLVKAILRGIENTTRQGENGVLVRRSDLILEHSNPLELVRVNVTKLGAQELQPIVSLVGKTVIIGIQGNAWNMNGRTGTSYTVSASPFEYKEQEKSSQFNKAS